MARRATLAFGFRAECLPFWRPGDGQDAWLAALAEVGLHPPLSEGALSLVGDDAGLTDFPRRQTDPNSRVERAVRASAEAHGFCDEAERRWLAEQAVGARWVIEIGSMHGRSALALTLAREGTTICVDRWRRPLHWEAFQRNCAALIRAKRIVPIRGESHAALGEVRAALQGDPADLIWLDGGHDEAVIRGDIGLYLRLLRPGGLLCGHDWGHPHAPGVQAAVKELLPGYWRGPGMIWAWRGE